MQRMRFFLLALALTFLFGAPARALVYLTSYNFASNDLPTIYTDDSFSGPYRLRAKIAGTFHATDLWNNNWTQLQGVPGTGTYTIDLYWVKYSSDYSTILEIGPFNTQTITISAPNQPPVPSISVDGYFSGATISRPNNGTTNITVRYSATDANGNLSGIRYNVWNATTGYFDNGGGGFVAQSGGSGQVVKNITLSTDGDWYFWTDVQDASGVYASTGAWGSGLHLSVQQAPLTVSVSASNAQLGQNSILTGSATDPNGNLQAIYFYVSYPGSSEWVNVGIVPVSGFSATVSCTWPISLQSPIGTYTAHIRAADSFGILDTNANISSNFVVAGGVAPTITAQPVNQTVSAGQPVSFSVVANGTPTPSYQWRKNGADIIGAVSATYSIASAQAADSGTYSVMVSNLAGTVTSTPVTLAVNVIAPSITTQPSALSVIAGQSATFTVAAAGSAPLSYQWKKDGVNISGAISSSYTIASAQVADGAGYSVVISNSAGSIASTTATLAVTASAPTITSQPQSLVINVSQAATFSVVAAGSAPFTYQWRKNGASIGGANASSYTIPNAQLADAGTYSVIVGNSAGSVTSNGASLAVNILAPGITTQPASQTANAGQSVTLSVSATGSAPLSYQWRKNGANISGATGANYTIGSVQPVDAAGYSVVVTNSAGSVTSNVATLTVTTIPPVRVALRYWQANDYPMYLWHYEDHEVWVDGHWEDYGHWEDTDGDGYADTWVVDGQTWIDGHYEWQSDWVFSYVEEGMNGSSWGTTNGLFDIWDSASGYSATNANRGSLTNSYNSGSLITFRAYGYAPGGNCGSYQATLYSPTGAFIATGSFGSGAFWPYSFYPGSYVSSGVFRVEITYLNASGISPTSGTVSYYIPVGVTIPPVITSQPNPAVQTVMAGTSVAYSVSASGATSYQWWKDGSSIAGANASTLILSNVQPSNNGLYSVVASNSGGSTTSTSVSLWVDAGVAPTITGQPVSQTVSAGQPVSLSVSATGSPAPSYQWKKNGSNIIGATAATYAIANAQAVDTGTYTVVVSNLAGIVTSSSATLTVNVIPPGITTQPANLAVSAGQSAMFSVVASGSAPLSFQWRKNGANIIGATSTSYTIGSAQTADNAAYSVLVTNSAGSIPSSNATLTVTVVAPSITSQPQNLVVNAAQSASFTVSASGSSPLSYQWRKNGASISGATNATYSLTSVQLYDAGSYSVTVSNSAGAATSNAALLSVNIAAPAITAHPVSQTVSIGQSVTLAVTASGSAPFTYQWRKNGAVISGAITATYTIPSAQPGDAASYTVVVGNSAGSVTSNAATLTVASNPPVRLALQYWQPGDGPSETWHWEDVWVDGQWVDGYWADDWGWDDGGSWTIVGSHWVDPHWEDGHYESQWVYSFSPEGQYGSTWTTTAGTFNIYDPASGYSASNASRGYLIYNYYYWMSVTLRAWASAPAGNCSSYQARLFSPAGAMIASSGITQDSYCEFNFYPNYYGGSGAYRVEISYQNASGTTPADGTVTYYIPVGVSLPPLPTITAQPSPANQTLASGANLTYSVGASGATSFQWCRNGVPLSGATGNVFSIAGVQSSDAGAYSVVVGNSAGSVTSNTVTLAVSQPLPSITSALNASGTVGWIFGGYTISATNGPSSFSATGLPSGLALNAATGVIYGTPTLAGTYNVSLSAANGGGTGPAAVLVLTVNGGAPAFVTQPSPSTQTVAAGASVSYSASVTGAVGFQWYKDGVALAGQTSSTISLSNLQSGQSGTYTVSASNTYGSTTSFPVVLNVTSGSSGDLSPPTAPGTLAVTAFSSTTVSLGWSAASDNVGVAGYSIYCGSSQVGSVPAGTLAFVHSGLSASTSYSYTVRAFDSAGNYSNPSNSVSATTSATASQNDTSNQSQLNIHIPLVP